MQIILKRPVPFETDLIKDGDTHFKITVPVAISPQFYAWVFGLKNYVTLEGPPSGGEGMKDMLSAVGKRYEGAQ